MRAKRQVLFVQGGGAGTHDEWDDKLVASLEDQLGQRYEVLYPRMPNEADPSLELWQTALQGLFETLRDGAILVGHSVGGTMLLKALLEHPSPRTLRAIFLVAAPFMGDGGCSSAELRFSSELGAQLPSGVPIHFFHGLDDETVPAAHVELYASAVPQASIHRLPGRDHQLNNDMREVAATILSLDAAFGQSS